MKVVITSPSIKNSDNISGISTLSNLLIKKQKKIHYYHFVIGKKDRDKRGFFWLIKQSTVPIRFLLYINYHKVDLIHINMPLMPLAVVRDYILLLISILNKKPVILHIRGGRFISKPPKRLYYYKLIRNALKKAKRIIVLGDIEREQIVNYYPEINKNKVIVLPNAVDVSSNKFKKEYNGKLKLLYLGRIDKSKGFQEIEKFLIDLMNKNIDYEFYLCGDGPYKDIFFRNLSSKLREKVIYKGVVSGAEKSGILKESHLFILPSYYEGLPNALLEAMEAGVVPICTPAGSIPGVISDKENGFIVPFHDVESIVEIIMQLNKDRALMKRIGKNAHNHIKENYSIDRYIDRLNKIYEEVAQANN